MADQFEILNPIRILSATIRISRSLRSFWRRKKRKMEKLSLPEFLALTAAERTKYLGSPNIPPARPLFYIDSRAELDIPVTPVSIETGDLPFTVVIPSKIMSNLRASSAAVRRNAPGAKIVWIDDRDNQEDVYRMPKGMERICGIKPFVFARNCNLGIKAAGTDDVILLNDDAILETPGGFSILAKAMSDHPEYGVLAAVTNNNGNVNQCQRGRSGCWDEPRIAAFICVYIRRTTIERVGLLDEAFVGYGRDDDDYCLRVQRAGMKVGICGDCFVEHEKLPSSYRVVNPHVSLAENDLVFIRKHGIQPR